MNTFRFLEFPVYIASKDFYLSTLSITQPFPKPYWDLGDQLRRAALSISLNIAEGSAKYSDKDFKRYIDNALGSASECVACMDMCQGNKLISKGKYDEAVIKLESIAKQLGGLSKKLRSSH